MSHDFCHSYISYISFVIVMTVLSSHLLDVLNRSRLEATGHVRPSSHALLLITSYNLIMHILPEENDVRKMQRNCHTHCSQKPLVSHKNLDIFH